MLARRATGSTVRRVSLPQLNRQPLGGNMSVIMRNFLLLSIFLLVLVGCPSIPNGHQKTEQEDRIVEATLSHFLADVRGNFYIGRLVGDSAMSINHELLHRLQTRYSKPSIGIHDMDEAELRDTRTSPGQLNAEHYVDKKTGQLGESLTIGEISWIDGSNAELRITTWFDPLFGGSTKYRLSRSRVLFLVDRGWKVDEAEMDTRF